MFECYLLNEFMLVVRFSIGEEEENLALITTPSFNVSMFIMLNDHGSTEKHLLVLMFQPCHLVLLLLPLPLLLMCLFPANSHFLLPSSSSPSTSSLYDADRGELASPDSVPGRDLDLLDAAATSAPSGVSLPPAIAPVIGAPTGFRSAGAAGIVLAATSTPTSSGAGAHHESVFAGGTYELEHPVNHLGNDLRNDAFGNRDDDDSG